VSAEDAIKPESVIDFWFSEIEPSSWWKKDAEFDALISKRFGKTHARAAKGELYLWRDSPDGRLAEIIVLDQFSRNIFRDTAAAFACDPMALALAQTAVELGADESLPPAHCSFLYMPYMHSESLAIHDQAMKLFERNGDPTTIEFERRHRAIIQRFGRYPHRNEVLGRASTEAELEFLEVPGSSF